MYIDEKQVNITEWVNACDNPDIKELRQAIHTLIFAIAKTPYLRKSMVMKGGVLLAIGFRSSRYTKDVDFSTERLYATFDSKKFLNGLRDGLAYAVGKLEYGLDCRVQSHEVRPKGDDKSFQTLKIKIGYAYNGSKQHKMLLNKNCSSVLAVDYSFNETNYKVDTIEIGEDKRIKVYSLADIVAEKYRAIIQQEPRNRNRRQDAYDIYCLMENGFLRDAALKEEIYASLIAKSESRKLKVSCDSLDDDKIVKRSKAEYKNLQGEISGVLPDFDECYHTVNKYYKSLPWDR